MGVRYQSGHRERRGHGHESRPRRKLPFGPVCAPIERWTRPV